MCYRNNMEFQKTDTKITTICLDVPFLGYQDAITAGYEKAVTSCGMCCVAMILSSHGHSVSLPELIQKGHAEGGFSSHGWVHQYFVDLLGKYSIPASKKEGVPLNAGFQEIKHSILNGKPVIVSGRKVFMEQTSFHMVLIVGISIDENDACTGFFYHDPASKNEAEGKHHFVSLDTFRQYWRQMAIMLE
jgi:hypothetical protein